MLTGKTYKITNLATAAQIQFMIIMILAHNIVNQVDQLSSILVTVIHECFVVIFTYSYH